MKPVPKKWNESPFFPARKTTDVLISSGICMVPLLAIYSARAILRSAVSSVSAQPIYPRIETCNQPADIRDRTNEAIRLPKAYVRWRDQFRALNESQLTALCEDPNDCVAVTAAWEKYLIRPTLLNEKGPRRIRKHGSEPFVSFCERKLSFQIPEWYKDLLANAELSQKTISFVDHEERPKRLAPTVWTYEVDQIAVRNGWIPVVKESEKYLIPVRNLPYADQGLACAFGKSRLFLAAIDRFPHHAILDCYAADGGGLKWRSPVWTGIFEGGVTFIGTPLHRAQVIVTERVVYVLGIGSFAAYIEGFNIDDGEACFRLVATTVTWNSRTSDVKN